jgi:hypothetical protein
VIRPHRAKLWVFSKVENRKPKFHPKNTLSLQNFIQQTNSNLSYMGEGQNGKYEFYSIFFMVHRDVGLIICCLRHWHAHVSRPKIKWWKANKNRKTNGAHGIGRKERKSSFCYGWFWISVRREGEDSLLSVKTTADPATFFEKMDWNDSVQCTVWFCNC